MASKKVTLEDLQNIVRDLGESQRELNESQKKTEESLREFQRKTEEYRKKAEESQRKTEESQRKTEESQGKTEESLRKLSKNLDKANGNFNNKWGTFMENLVKGDLVALLKSRSIEVVRVQPRMVYLRPDGNMRGEIDLVAINGDKIVAVEVKTTLVKENVDDFVDKKLANFKIFFPEFADKKIYGGLAYLDTAAEVASHAEKRGLFLIAAGGAEAGLSVIVNGKDFLPTEF